MPSFILATGTTLHLVGLCANRTGVPEASALDRLAAARACASRIGSMVIPLMVMRAKFPSIVPLRVRIPLYTEILQLGVSVRPPFTLRAALVRLVRAAGRRIWFVRDIGNCKASVDHLGRANAVRLDEHQEHRGHGK